MTKGYGGKFGGDHTTMIDLATDLAYIAIKYDEVTKVVPGFIKASREGAAGGERRVKFSETQGGLLLKIRQSHSSQGIRIYTNDPPSTRLALARAALALNAKISFQKPS